jgi:hypothetical protein
MSSGKIYVFDLDETLVSSIKGVIVPNPYIVRRIYDAVQLRNSKKGIDAILLLTNNFNLAQKKYGSNVVDFEGGFLNQALIKIVQEYNKICTEKKTELINDGADIFNLIYTGEQKFFNSGKRTRKQIRAKYGEAVKDINTVRNMIEDLNRDSEVKISTADLESRIFFFDDDGSHVLRGEISKQGFILINPKFGTGNNATNYSSVNKFHSRSSTGGKRRKTRRLGKD